MSCENNDHESCVCVQEGGSVPCECECESACETVTPADPQVQNPSFEEMMETMTEQREAILGQIDQALNASKGELPSRKELRNTLVGVRNLIAQHEKLIQAVMHDMMVIVNNLGRSDSIVFQVSTTIAAIVQTLVDKSVLTQAEVQANFVKTMQEMRETVNKEAEEADKKLE